jgi:hypothetical protein
MWQLSSPEHLVLVKTVLFEGQAGLKLDRGVWQLNVFVKQTT